MTAFRDRRDGGRRLAAALGGAHLEDAVVLALPRGGVPVGAEVAAALGAPLEVFVARKIGAPGRPEYGIGAIAEGGEPLFDPWAVRTLGLPDEELVRLADAARRELERRVRQYRGGRRLPSLAGHDVVLVDDGLATGVTAEAALRALQGRGGRRLVLGVPVCAPASAARLDRVAEVVCVSAPPDFHAVGAWYADFDQTSDDEVVKLLAAAATRTVLASRPHLSPSYKTPAAPGRTMGVEGTRGRARPDEGGSIMADATPVHRYPTITPHLAVDDPGAALDWYARAFGAEELVRLHLPDGSVAHGEMLIGGALVTLGKAIEEFHLVAPMPDQPVQVTITWFCDDVDAAYARAVEAGATPATPAADQFHGDRVGTLRCPFGHRWVVATHLEDVPYEVQQRRLDEMMGRTVTT